jgi:GxxExxY protein
MLTTEDTEFLNKEVTRAVIAAAISVHKELGPGLLESVYETCLAYELTARGYRIELQKEVPLVYRNIKEGPKRISL